MAETITYSSYTFPSPTPLVGESSEMVYVEGSLDNFIDQISVVGNLTGENLSGLHLQKMKMVSGMQTEFGTLSISNDSATKQYKQATPISIAFSESDLTTVLPYSVSFTSPSSGVLSGFFGVDSPSDTWTFTEKEGKIVNASHMVSAKGVKTGSISPLVTARHFVTGRTTGCIGDLGVFNTGGNAFLTSRTEKIDKSTNTYALTETYEFSTRRTGIISDSGIVTTSTSVSYEKEGGLSVSVNGSIFGSIDANITGGLLNTGNFTPTQAQEVAVNAVRSSLSDYESGSYTFINRGPTNYDYTVNTGENKVDFSFTFSDPDNVDQSGNVLHIKNASVAASKDQSIITVSINGELRYNGPFDIAGTGDPVTGARFQEVEQVFSGVTANSGFLNMAVENFRYFREDATGYYISGDYLNPIPISSGVTKNPQQSFISYSAAFDNKIDLSSGALSGLQVTISDKKPIELSGIVPSTAGFAKQKIFNRTLGEYGVSANCEASTGTLATLEQVVSGYITGIYDISKNSSSSDQSLSLSWSRFY